jgi:lipoyl(octanoyl) transferase
MQTFTSNRSAKNSDELWLVEHDPVFTQGMAGKAEHILAPRDIPVVQVDRGGQVTYHGPGQQMLYVLIDLKRYRLSVRDLVSCLENSVINLFKDFSVSALARADAPGVYVDSKKVCSLGLRIRRGCSFHGLALNVNMDLSPFRRINPCGYAALEMTDCKRLGLSFSLNEAAKMLVIHLLKQLNIENYDYREGFDG